MGAMLDLIGSYVFKAAMIGIIISTSYSLNQVMVEKSQLVIAEKNLNVAISVIEWDLKNIGFGLPTPTTSITKADIYGIEFTADVNNDGVTDAVRWWYQYVGYTAGIGYRYNVFRSVNGVSYTAIRDIYYNTSTAEVSWRFYYYNASGAIMTHDYAGGYEISPTNRPNIRGVKVFMKTKSPLVVNNQYITAQREFSVFPANLSLN